MSKDSQFFTIRSNLSLNVSVLAYFVSFLNPIVRIVVTCAVCRLFAFDKVKHREISLISQKNHCNIREYFSVEIILTKLQFFFYHWNFIAFRYFCFVNHCKVSRYGIMRGSLRIFASELIRVFHLSVQNQSRA